MNTMHIVLAGGGAPGHWFPGLTVAHQIRAVQRRAQITFLGTAQDFESRNATVAGFQYVPIWPDRPAAGWSRAWRFLTDEVAAQRAARRFFKRHRPDVVVALAGRASAPAIRAALGLEIPFALIEYNALPVAVTSKYANHAAVVFGAYAQLRQHLPTATALQIVGNPIRPGFAEVFRLRQKSQYRTWHASTATANGPARQLVVLAGTSREGRLLNESVPKSLYKVKEQLGGWKIVHQTGNRGFRATRALYSKLGVPAEIMPFIPDMPRVLLHSDVAIARPGAITLSELSAAMVPGVLVPSGKSSERHQSANAAAFAAEGACRVVNEVDPSRRLDDRLAEALGGLLSDTATRAGMSAAMGELAYPQAAAQVAAMLLQLPSSTVLQNVA
jgi:UDP-N-acetylglucosamine--N-acetylmuramyl-(pentapeptide) pyrophosphoryl-undecaprenol N-acetylglucosamine transferase